MMQQKPVDANVEALGACSQEGYSCNHCRSFACSMTFAPTTSMAFLHCAHTGRVDATTLTTCPLSLAAFRTVISAWPDPATGISPGLRAALWAALSVRRLDPTNRCFVPSGLTTS